MRKTSLVTISLPPAMIKESAELANTYQMTRSEFLRAAIRNHIDELKKQQAKKRAWEEKYVLKIISRFEKAKKEGKIKTLQPGDLAKWAAES
jgi:metal-responsive CopG/Arc/MetJ family transcriptional regulator